MKFSLLTLTTAFVLGALALPSPQETTMDVDTTTIADSSTATAVTTSTAHEPVTSLPSVSVPAVPSGSAPAAASSSPSFNGTATDCGNFTAPPDGIQGNVTLEQPGDLNGTIPADFCQLPGDGTNGTRPGNDQGLGMNGTAWNMAAEGIDGRGVDAADGLED